MSWLAIDIGARRTGVAISWSGTLATPYRLVAGSLESQAQELATIITKEHIQTLVVGQPRRQLTARHPSKRLLRVLESRFAPEERPTLVFVDETLTTKEAERLAADREVDTDILAAQLILEQYLREQEAIHAE